MICRESIGEVFWGPISENPGFDFLKSKLTEFGTVGPCGADGPHELGLGELPAETPQLPFELPQLTKLLAQRHCNP